ncbi:MAG TPA: hypothetical protein ENK49_13105 [Gammaproteobacteria bacterium]|nr:hypothetical protein [Gammaproteobacteria bacterium]
MHSSTRFFLYLAAVFLAAPAAANHPCDDTGSADGQWEPSAQTALATLYRPRNSRLTSPAALVRIQWDYTPELLYEIVQDYAHFAAFIPQVAVSRVVAKQADRVWVYQQLHLPGPASDRHYLMTSTQRGSKPALRQYRVEWQLSTRYPLPGADRLVVPRRFRGCWSIHPDGRGGLVAGYWIELDPGGWLPRWVTQAALRQYLADLMRALHQRAASLSAAER